MEIYPAIDLYGGKAVRLYQGDYEKMTVYRENPVEAALEFAAAGARRMHLVDLAGAREGKPADVGVVARLREAFSGFVQVGGGIRNMETVKYYLDLGVDRVILGTAAVRDPAFLQAAVTAFGEKIAVGVDLKDGMVAVSGWTRTENLTADAFFAHLDGMGVSAVICTDISRDGAMEGTNRELYAHLSENYGMDLIASGGVSSMEDIGALKAMGLHGAIIGKAYYTGAVDLREAVEAAK